MAQRSRVSVALADAVTNQAGIAARARAEMPPPVPYDPAAMIREAVTRGDVLDLIGLPDPLAARRAEAETTRLKAIDVMTTARRCGPQSRRDPSLRHRIWRPRDPGVGVDLRHPLARPGFHPPLGPARGAQRARRIGNAPTSVTPSTTSPSGPVFGRRALDGVGDDRPLRAVAAAGGKRPVLAAQPSRTIGLSAIRDTEIWSAVVDLLPPLAPGPGFGVSLPASALGGGVEDPVFGGGAGTSATGR
jgi:hypothetical protein